MGHQGSNNDPGDFLLQLPGVVGHYEIGHEGQGAGDHPDFCQIASASHRDRADVNRSLQSVHELAALEHLVDRVPEVRQSEVITQVNVRKSLPSELPAR
jgi:hypothetical protein